MKKIILFSFFACTPFFVKAQCSAQSTVTPNSCFNACDGTATIIPVGGTPPFTYLWNPGGQTVATAVGLCAGTYTGYFLDANACSATVSVTITQPTQISLALTIVSDTCSGPCCSGAASVVATGGIPPYTYNWIPSGGTNDTATSLCPGTYSITVTDTNGCAVGSLLTIISSAGIHDASVVENLSLYPNPAFDNIFITESFSNNVPVELSISNFLGQTVYFKSISGTKELNESINVAELPAGIYFISVITPTGNSIQKFTKQ